jgi:hypothetical protein
MALLHNLGIPSGGLQAGNAKQKPVGKDHARKPNAVLSLLLYVATSLLQIFTQLHSFEYGTRLIRYPDFTPVTT